MKYIVILLVILLLTLSACSNQGTQLNNTVEQPVDSNNTNNANQSDSTNETVIDEIDMDQTEVEEKPLQRETVTISLATQTEVLYEDNIYTFTIDSANDNKARITVTSPDETDQYTIAQGDKIKLDDNVFFYVSSVSIIQFPEQSVDARLTLSDFEKGEVFILEEDDILSIQDINVEIELTNFEVNKDNAQVDIEFPKLNLEGVLEQNITTKIGPFTFTPMTIDALGKEIVTKVEYDESKGIAIEVTREKTDVFVNGEVYEIAFKNTFIDTTKDQPIQVEIRFEGRDYVLDFNKKTEIKKVDITITDIYTEEDSDDDWIKVKIE